MTPIKNNSWVNSHNEWDEVEEIIVGTAQYARIPTQDAGFLATVSSAKDVLFIDIIGSYPKRIIEETEEDIDAFIAELIKLGIKVRRPHAELRQDFATPECDPFFPYCPRDVLLI